VSARLHVVVPVLDESPNVPRLVRDLGTFTREIGPDLACRVIFVDDGSTDGTAERIEAERGGLDVTVLRHPSNRGPGAAFRTAFEHLAPLLRPEDWVLTLEGDNTSRLSTVKQMLVRRREGFDVVLASPYAYGGGITQTSLVRTFLSHMANGLVKELLGIHGILTMSSFVRLYSAPILGRLQARHGPGIVDSRGFECMVELLRKLVDAGATISEVAMPLDGSLREGPSKMPTLRTIRGYLRLFLNRRGDRG
jgi:dolichol-phosphate mannosyltransferase